VVITKKDADGRSLSSVSAPWLEARMIGQAGCVVVVGERDRRADRDLVVECALVDRMPLEDQVTSSEVCLFFQLVTCHPEQAFLVVQPESGLVPGKYLVTDLVGLGEPDPGRALAPVN
jgi:hypothetical protein